MALKDYKSMSDIHYGRKGPCIAPGHEKEHVLEMHCLSEMRRWCFKDMSRTFSDLIEAVNRK